MMAKTMVDVPAALRNTMQILQTKPGNYKLFGVYWWAMKAQLKEAGYTMDNLYLLGSYVDHETAAQIPRAGLEETLRAAFTEYGHNATFSHGDGRVEAPDGELVTIWDGDAGY
jgi:hypothetical protein